MFLTSAWYSWKALGTWLGRKEKNLIKYLQKMLDDMN
jgi:hypothetical protein